MSPWHPASWQSKPARQQPTYPSQEALYDALAQLAELPPLVTSWEVDNLKRQLAEAGAGRAFVLQGGDCAENFADCRGPVIADQLKILLQMSLVLIQGMKRRVIRIGRIAGQYAKPRSADLESRDGTSLPSYRGDLVNGPEFTPEARTPDPQRLLRGYGRSALTLNFIRALADCGFADLRHPENWDLEFVRHSPLADEYRRMVASLEDSLRFLDVIGGTAASELHRVQFFTSHEGLHLHYEQALTRQVGPHPSPLPEGEGDIVSLRDAKGVRRPGHYNLSTHMPWIGLRTAELEGAHVEYFRGIENPVGVKVGIGMDAAWIQGVVRALNPKSEPGKLALIHRFGSDRIEAGLPPFINAVRETGIPVVWICDPMHGNTESTTGGLKTRRFDRILSELEQAFQLHAAHGSHLGGVHFELTGDDVTECIGGARGLDEAGLERAYKSSVDPRLNYEQALEMAMSIVRRVERTA